MFLNIKINIKILIIMLIIFFTILSLYGGYIILSKSNTYDTISVNTNNFTNVLKEIYTNPYVYENKIIKVSGFIYTTNEFNEDEFVIARNMIVCCETEPFIVGFLCKTNKNMFNNNDWVNIKGIIKIENDTPYILVNKINNAIIPMKDTVLPPTI